MSINRTSCFITQLTKASLQHFLDLQVGKFSHLLMQSSYGLCVSDIRMTLQTNISYITLICKRKTNQHIHPPEIVFFHSMIRLYKEKCNTMPFIH